SLLALVLEGNFDLGPIRLDLAVIELQVQLRDLGNPQVAQGLARAGDSGRGRFLPGLRAGSDELDDFVDALSHGVLRKVVKSRWTACKLLSISVSAKFAPREGHPLRSSISEEQRCAV